MIYFLIIPTGAHKYYVRTGNPKGSWGINENMYLTPFIMHTMQLGVYTSFTIYSKNIQRFTTIHRYALRRLFQ